jgi:hypothetical protein
MAMPFGLPNGTDCLRIGSLLARHDVDLQTVHALMVR